jgi:chromosome partitioning protein
MTAVTTAPKRKRSETISRGESPGKLVVVGNLKGGSGKSTVAFNLAVWLSTRGVDLELVDLDPQRTLSDLVAVRQEVGASPLLAAPATMPGQRIDGRWTLVDFGAADMERMGEVVPEADLILVPVLPSQADIWATQRYLKMILPLRKKDAHIVLFVNRADAEASRETRETMTALKAMAGMCDGVWVLPAMLGRRIVFCRSLSEGRGVFELKAKSKASDEFDAFARSALMPMCGAARTAR